MKKLIGMLALIAITLSTVAQDGNKTKDNTPDASAKSGKKVKKDCFMMKDGHMLVRKDGKKTKMDKTITLPNGIKVGTDGKITMADGKTKMLAEGEKIFMDGTISKKKAKKADD